MVLFFIIFTLGVKFLIGSPGKFDEQVSLNPTSLSLKCLFNGYSFHQESQIPFRQNDVSIRFFLSNLSLVKGVRISSG